MEGGIRLKRVWILWICLLLCGCKDSEKDMDAALSLRSAILQAERCTFTANITADYGDMVYNFSLDCTVDGDGNVSFVVTAPETIAGITGKITADGGNLTFDDTVLYIPMLTDDQITPVSCPWILMKTLRSGYITSCADGRVTIDDSYADDALTLDISLGSDGMPASADIFWKNRRILTIEVVSFTLS